MKQETKSKHFDKRKDLFYRLLTVFTLVLPMPVYLVISASILNIEPDYVLSKNVDTSNFVLQKDELDLTYFYVDLTTAPDTFEVTGTVMFSSTFLVLPFNEETIFKVASEGYYQVTITEEDTAEWHNHTTALFNKELSYKIPIAVIFGILAIVIVMLIIFKRMNVLKKKPRLGTLLTLTFATLTFLILEMIVSSMLGIFITATLTWATYCLEYVVYNRKTIFKDKEKEQSEVVKRLAEVLSEYK